MHYKSLCYFYQEVRQNFGWLESAARRTKSGVAKKQCYLAVFRFVGKFCLKIPCLYIKIIFAKKKTCQNIIH